MKVLIIDPNSEIHNKYSKKFKDLGLFNITYVSEIDATKVELFDIVLSDGVIFDINISIPIIILCDDDQRSTHHKDFFYLNKSSTAEDIVRTIKVLCDSLDWAMEFYNYKSSQNQNFKVNIENIQFIVDQILELFPNISTSRLYLILLELCYILKEFEILVFQDKNGFKIQVSVNCSEGTVVICTNNKIAKSLHISPYICDNLSCVNQKITVEIKK